MHSLKQNPNLHPDLRTMLLCLVNSGSCICTVHRKQNTVLLLQGHPLLYELFCAQHTGKNQHQNLSILYPQNNFGLRPTNITKITSHIIRTVKNATWYMSAPATTQALQSNKPFQELNRDWRCLCFVVPTFWTLCICHEIYNDVGSSSQLALVPFVKVTS